MMVAPTQMPMNMEMMVCLVTKARTMVTSGDQAPCAVLRCRFAVTGSIADNGQSEHENGHQTYTDKISFLFHDSLLSCIVLF